MSPSELLEKCFFENPLIRSWVIAYSGGLDSSVLLHVVASIQDSYPDLSFKCVYVHHGLQEEATVWQEHCKNKAASYEIDYLCHEIKSHCPKGESVEAWARQQRYTFFQSLLDETTALITAHHNSDQVETFFLNLFRGSGLSGLSAMNEKRRLGDGWHMRPFLQIEKVMLQDYAEKNKLIWVDDPSNADNAFDRNLLRNTLLPQIRKRWDRLDKTIIATNRRLQEAESLVKDLALQDLNSIKNSKLALQITLLKQLSKERQKNLLLYWIKENKFDLPGQRHIEQCLKDLCENNINETGCVSWANTECRRYRDELYLMYKMPKITEPNINWNIDTVFHWVAGELSAVESLGEGVAIKYFKDKQCEIRYRKGGEFIFINQDKVDVKNLFQEHSILPWFRDFIPLIYIDNELVQIPCIATNEKFKTKKNEKGVNITIKNIESLCQ